MSQDVNDAFDLKRFVSAQEQVFQRAVEELRQGRKRSHWMWFIFPQLRGLGRSHLAVHYGIGDLQEARAYLAHAVLGPRLEEATRAVLDSPADSLSALFGDPDDMKFRSSMTLFHSAAAKPDDVYWQALERWCGGTQDEATLSLLRQSSG